MSQGAITAELVPNENLMGKISFEALKPEMKLAGDVIERTGRVLLRAGTEITEKHLDILRKWGVTEVDAEGATVEVPAEDLQPLDPAVLHEAENRAQALFRHTDSNHPAVRELLRLCTLRLVRHKLRDGNHVS
jgi:hypothetical protein